MRDTFDPIAFLSAVSGDGDWPDEFLAWYEPGKWLSDERACAAFVAGKFVQLQADRDSWYQQHSDRVDDAVKFAAERDAARELVVEASAIMALLQAAERALVDCCDLIGTQAGECLKIAVEQFKKDHPNASVFSASPPGRKNLGRRPLALHRDIPDGIVRGVPDLGVIVEWTHAAWQEAATQEREACAAIVDKWSTASYLTLHAGEMTAQELRTVQAVVTGIEEDIRSRGAKA